VAATSEFQKLEHSAVKLTIKLTKDDVRSEYDKHLKEFLKDAQLPGFRRGKVPQAVLEKKAGPALKEDVLNRIIAENINEVLENGGVSEENSPLSYSDPQVDGTPKLELDSDLSFSVIYDVMPQVKVDTWEGFEAEVDEAEITDGDIQRELEKIRERNAIVVDRNDDAPAETGDIVTVDYCELDDNGTVIGDSLREDFVWMLGDGNNLYKIDDEVTGMKKNETKDFEKNYPDDFADKELAGKTKKLRVKVKGVKEKDLPDLDDELAQDVDEKFKTLDDLKKSIKERLETRLADGLAAMRQQTVIDKIIEANPIDLPESMIKIEMANTAQRMFGGHNMSGEAMERFLDTHSNFVELWRPQVEKGLKGRLIVGELMKQQNFEISDAEREQEVADYAKRTGATPEDIKKTLETNSIINSINDTIRERKMFALIESKNNVKKGKKVNYLDLFPDNA
jgi:trigger factor